MTHHKESPFLAGFGEVVEGFGALIEMGRSEEGEINDGNGIRVGASGISGESELRGDGLKGG